MKFRKKPVVIEATQFNGAGDHPSVIVACKSDSGEIRLMGTGRPCFALKTLEGWHEVSQGDWIITGVKGEQYPCKPDIFEATYSPAYEEGYDRDRDNPL
jgi:hypothetical protein